MWLWRLGLAVRLEPEAVAEPYRLTLTGRPGEAAGRWRQVGAVYDAALADTDAADADQVVRGIEQLDLLGATAVADRLRRSLHCAEWPSCRPGRGPAPAPTRPG